MSISKLSQVMLRIEGAEPSSPIAVFRCWKAGMLQAVFADTIQTQQMIAERHPDLIGVFDGTMNQNQIMDQLAGHVRPLPAPVPFEELCHASRP